MSLSRPIIFNTYTEYNPLYLSKAGIKSNSLSPKDFAESIKYCMNLPIEEKNRLTSKAFKYVSQYHSYENLAEKLNSFLDQI